MSGNTREVFRQNLPSGRRIVNLQTNNLPPGMYFVKATSLRGVSVGMFVVAR